MASFGGVTFGLLIARPGLTQEAAVSVRHVPAGNVTYIDRGGIQAARLSGTVKLDSLADLTSLRALLGTSGTLSYSEGDFAATLLSLSRQRVTPNGVQLVDAEWVLE